MRSDLIVKILTIPINIEEKQMKAERVIRIFAGTVVLISLALGVDKSPFFISSYILWVTVFVGANLFQSGFTQFCLLDIILKKTGICKD